MINTPALTDFPLRSYDKIRYGDTDPQGHVNNAVFSTYLETGRAEIMVSPQAETGSTYVIARLELDYVGEITWPGTVEIGTMVESIGRSSFKLYQGLFQNDRCVGVARTVLVMMDKQTRRSRPLNDDMREYLAGLQAKNPLQSA
jgi:acyl-CoA thioester hydrolase